MDPIFPFFFFFFKKQEDDQAGGYSRDCALLPPSSLSRGEPVRAAAAYLGVRADEAREKETEG